MADGKEPGTPGYRKGKTSGTGTTSPYRPQRVTSSPNWRDVDATTLSDAAGAITQRGDALLIGGSIDGGVLVLTICAGNERIKYYAQSATEMTAHLVEIIKGLSVRAGS